MKLYAVRDRKTGKLVNNITNPKRRFWKKKGVCRLACLNPHPDIFTGDKTELEVVEFEVVERRGTQSNADQIRSMSDEELAVTLTCPNEMGLAEIPCDHSDTRNCCKCLFNWLQQPAEEE